MAKVKLSDQNIKHKCITNSFFSVDHYEGRGPASLVSTPAKQQPVRLILVNRADSIHVEAAAVSRWEVRGGQARLIYAPEIALHFTYTGVQKWEFFELRYSRAFLETCSPMPSPRWDLFFNTIKTAGTSLPEGECIYFKPLLKELIYSLFEKQFEEPEFEAAYLTIKMKEFSLRLAHELLLPAPQDNQLSNKHYQFALKARNLLDKYKNSRAFTTQSVAAAIGTNETTLKYAFKNAMGITMYQYFMQRQMKLAQKMLNRGQPVKKVSRLLGYNHMSSFSEQFKRIFGVSPESVKGKN